MAKVTKVVKPKAVKAKTKTIKSKIVKAKTMVVKPKNVPCVQEGCKSKFVSYKDMEKHDYKHQVFEGHRNSFSCEICCHQCERADNLNRHRRRVHGMPALLNPHEAVEFVGSFKLIAYFPDMSETNHTNRLTIEEFSGYTDDGRGKFKAHYLNHTQVYVNGIRRWEIVDEGGDYFEVFSERDTCCRCKFSFLKTKDFAEHMFYYHPLSVYLEKLTPEREIEMGLSEEDEMGHKQFSIYDTEYFRGGCFDLEHGKFSKVNPKPRTIRVEALEEDVEDVFEHDQEIENDQGVVDYFPPIEKVGLNETFIIEHAPADDDNGDEIIIDYDNCHGLSDAEEYDDSDDDIIPDASDDDIVSDTSVKSLEVSSSDDSVTIVEAVSVPFVSRLSLNKKRKVKTVETVIVPFVSKLSLKKKRKADNVPTVSNKRYHCDSEDFILARDLYNLSNLE